MSLYERPQLNREMSGNPSLARWQEQRRVSISETVYKRDISKLFSDYTSLPYSNIPPLSRDKMYDSEPEIREALVDHKLQSETKKLVLNAFEVRAQQEGLSMGIWTLQELEQSRNEVGCADMRDVNIVAKNYLLPDEYQKKYLILPEAAQRELVSESLARKKAERKALSYMEGVITDEEIQTQLEVGGSGKKKEVGKTQFGNHSETVIPAATLSERPEVLFGRSLMAKFDVKDWLSLPIKPLLIPNGEIVDRDNPHALATYLWNKILYSPLFVDRNGKEVAMDEATTEKYIAKIQQYIEKGEPIRASEYTPLIAIPNPLKRRTQQVTLAEIDFFRRLAEVSKAISLFYEPGLQWEVVNEIPAFSEAFNLKKEYVDAFHGDCQQIVEGINKIMGSPTIHLTRMDDYISGANAPEFERYKKQKLAMINEALSNNSHPQHDQVSKEIQTFAYPMATCINPLDCEAAQAMNVSEIVSVYEALRQETGSIVRGVGMGESISKETFSREQYTLLDFLRKKGLELSINYRVTMDAREGLPSFDKLNDTVKYTMVTKANKPVLFPNSHRGPSFPAHGETILIPNDGGWPTVTVKPWIQVLTGKDEFNTSPSISEVTNDVLYFS